MASGEVQSLENEYLARMYENAVRRFDGRVDEIASRLRRLADEVEREGYSSNNRVGMPSYGWKASQIVHAITWGVANMNLSGLVAVASEVDAAGKEVEHG